MGEGLLQPMHLLLILGIALIVFGPKKLPELGKGLGEAIRGFKTSLRDEDPIQPAKTPPSIPPVPPGDPGDNPPPS
jgi:sec-independent protein translocase protein TatA